MSSFGQTDHVEVTIEDLFIEHYDPPMVPPKASAAMKGDPTLRKLSKRITGLNKRKLPHPTSLLGIVLLGGLIAGAGFLGYRRLIA